MASSKGLRNVAGREITHDHLFAGIGFFPIPDEFHGKMSGYAGVTEGTGVDMKQEAIFI
jgi:hypothetical protein